MATLSIAEFPGIAGIKTTWGQITGWPPLAKQLVAIGTPSAPSTQLGPNTYVVRVQTDTACAIEVGDASVVADTTHSARFSANATEYMAVQPGAYIAVIAT